MANQIRIVFTTILILISAPLTAIAGPCDAYFGFDNTLADASGNAYDGEMIGANGAAAKANYTEGKFGQALELDGTGGMRALIDLHWDICPQVTISAWIKVSRDTSNASPVLFSTGQGSGPGLYFTTNYLRLNGTDNGIFRPDVVRPGSWMFVAGVYNYDTGIYELYYGARSPVPGKLAEHRREPENAFWIGTENDGWDSFAGGVAVDELRITGQALERPEVMALQASAPTADAGNDNGESAVVDSGQLACDSQSNCPSGNYCAVDNVCYPNSQLPQGYATPESTTGGSGQARPGFGDTNPNPTPGGDMLSDLDIGETGPSTIYVPFSDGLAGRWQYIMNQDGAFMAMSVEFRGPDTSLGGHMWVTAGSMFGNVEQDEAMSSVRYVGNVVEFSTPSMGDFVGVVSDDGSTITSTEAGPSGPVVLERVSSVSVHRLGPDDAEPTRTMEGSWIHDTMACYPIGGCNGATAYLTFSAADSELSGHYSAIINDQILGNSIVNYALTDIVLSGRAISFSTESGSELAGAVSEDGTELAMPSSTSESGYKVYTKQ